MMGNGNIITSVCAKFNYDRLHIDKVLGYWKSDNNNNKNIVHSAWGLSGGGAKFAGQENDGQRISGGGNCRTGKWWTKVQGWNGYTIYAKQIRQYRDGFEPFSDALFPEGEREWSKVGYKRCGDEHITQ